MSIAPGSRLGTYDIVAPLGAGGMGEVYRARDSKLGRDVALKILPAAVAADPERLARFEREAKTLAALNHPHIAHIYGFENHRSGGASDPPGRQGSAASVAPSYALVMELVDGQDLSQRLARGPIPLEEALPIARQIAEALEAAHEQGIIHRDLKPANIKVRAEGTVKVLDFGLAKAIDGAGRAGGAGANEVLNSPTITSPAMTAAGMILGTAAYMSPEQAKGSVVDKRADIWAFGAVLYEMLTARRAFAGDDVSDTLASILKTDPDWNALPAETPTQLRLLMKRCLARDRRARISDMGVVRFLLNEDLSRQGAEAHPSARPRRGLLVGGGAAIGALVVAGLMMLFSRPEPTTPAGPVRFTITPPASRPLSIIQTTAVDRNMVMANDGRSVIYRGGPTGRPELVVRDLGAFDERVISGSVGARGPFSSPDSRFVGFFVGGQLRRAPLNGGPPTVICPAGVSRGATWGEDDNIIFATAEGDVGLSIVPAAGGTPQVLTRANADAGELDHVFPSYLPGSQAVLFTITSRTQSSAASGALSTVAVLDLKTRQHKTLVQGATRAAYAESGHLVYAAGNTLMAAPFDVAKLAITGEAVAIIADASADFSLASNGTLVYASARDSGDVITTPRTLAWVDRDGREESLAAPARAYHTVRLSPDETRIALQTGDGQADIWVWDIARALMTRLTSDAADEQTPIWTPDGRRLIWSTNRLNNPNLYWQPADGTGMVERLTEAPFAQFPTAISRDGRQVLFVEFTGTESRLQKMTLPAPGAATRVRGEMLPVSKGGVNFGAELSPDQEWLAYQSSESGQPEIYVRPFPNVDASRWQISTDGGSRPMWSPDGRELFYLDRENVLTSVRVTPSEPAPTFARPVRLLKTPYFPGSTLLGLPMRGFDVSRDGKRFLMIKEPTERPSSVPLESLTVVLNWHEELKQRVRITR